MAKALKPLIIAQLVISIAALVLGVLLFQQREILKRRTQILEDNTAEFAKAIHHDEFQADAIKDYATMEGPLRQLVATGITRWQELQDTKQDLANTKQDLEQTKLELATTKTQLSDANDQIAQLSDTLNQREAQLAEANTRVSTLETEAADLKTEIEELNAKSAEVEEEMADLQANYDSLKADFDKLVGETTGAVAARGLSGRVLLVNPEWNFVVLDIGSEKGIAPAVEMLVHRADSLVGRVRISTVSESLAIGEIMGSWEQRAIRKGDYVISPES